MELLRHKIGLCGKRKGPERKRERGEGNSVRRRKRRRTTAIRWKVDTLKNHEERQREAVMRETAEEEERER